MTARRDRNLATERSPISVIDRESTLNNLVDADLHDWPDTGGNSAPRENLEVVSAGGRKINRLLNVTITPDVPSAGHRRARSFSRHILDFER